ncbi:hypothetical protein RJ639_002024 [Escallonia herrerae]|uniref:t-SNARE coiled-coil homology domain-containing protein n=1 Tax=Escallonia herrerae TaxID=1293975 RepID=A0AA88XRV0_9ASTE|nr:hypothetical protein RJ639_002024 [Escallonia herrerae]
MFGDLVEDKKQTTLVYGKCAHEVPHGSMEHRSSKAALFDSFDGIEEGDLRAASSYSRDIDEVDNDKAIDSLQDRVIFLKRLTGDIHEEVNSHNRMLDQMVCWFQLSTIMEVRINQGNKMDASRGKGPWIDSKWFVDKIVFEKKSSRRMCALVSCFFVSFFIMYYLMRSLACTGINLVMVMVVYWQETRGIVSALLVMSTLMARELA